MGIDPPMLMSQIAHHEPKEVKMPAPKKKDPEVGDRATTLIDLEDGGCSILIHEIKVFHGQRYNVPVGELRLDSRAKAKEVAIWIR